MSFQQALHPRRYSCIPNTWNKYSHVRILLELTFIGEIGGVFDLQKHNWGVLGDLRFPKMFVQDGSDTKPWTLFVAVAWLLLLSSDVAGGTPCRSRSQPVGHDPLRGHDPHRGHTPDVYIAAHNSRNKNVMVGASHNMSCITGRCVREDENPWSRAFCVLGNCSVPLFSQDHLSLTRGGHRRWRITGR